MKDANNIIIGFTWQCYANHKSSAIARNMKLGNVQTEAPTAHGDTDTEGLQRSCSHFAQKISLGPILLWTIRRRQLCRLPIHESDGEVQMTALILR